MEPMTLGSPSGSPLPSSGYLPPFLMGDTPTTPRTNTLSPTKGRVLAFTQSPSSSFPTHSPDFNNRSTTGFTHKFALSANLNQSAINHNTSVSGPPTHGLFDSFRNDKHLFQTPTKNTSSLQNQHVNNALGTPGLNQSTANDTCLNRSGFNTSRIMSPIPINREHDFARDSSIALPLNQTSTRHDYWITVFGFPQSASSMILSHFSQCGAIIDKVFATQNGNWVHIRFTSRLECDKALNYNGKIIGQNLMIGVQYCNDSCILGRDTNDDRKEQSLSTIRLLTHIAYKNAQHPTDVVPSPTAPKRSSGIVNKAMDLFFGW